jgi:hypothetical protein
MILVCGEALIDLFVGPAEGAEMPERAVEASLAATVRLAEISEIDSRKRLA